MDLSASVRPFSSASWGDRLYLWDLLADCKHGLQIEVMLCLSAMTVSVVNYDNFSDCFEYRIITIIIITKGMRICFLGSRCRCHLSTATIVAAGLAVVGLNCCCSSGHAWLYFFIAPSRRADPWRPAAAARWLQCEGARKPKPMIVPQRGNCTHEHEILCAFSIFYASVPFDLVVVVVDCNFPPPPSSG